LVISYWSFLVESQALQGIAMVMYPNKFGDGWSKKWQFGNAMKETRVNQPDIVHCWEIFYPHLGSAVLGFSS
jgi:hypothetical protein